MWMYSVCVQTDTKLISGPVGTTLACGPSTKYLQTLFQEYVDTETHKDSNLWPTILKYHKAGFGLILHHCVLSLLLKKAKIKLEKNLQPLRRTHHIIWLISHFSWNCCSDRQNPSQTRPVVCVEWTFLHPSLLLSLTKMIHFSITAMSLWNQLCNQWWLCKQWWHLRANVFILGNNASRRCFKNYFGD